jgi:3-isopropylmalate/(R)-2-methylmalate dehydratase large subunit
MPQTMTEKILARASGRESVKPGDDILARPDFVIAYDFPGYTDVFFRETREDFGVEKVSRPDRFVLFIDHMVPAAAPKE